MANVQKIFLLLYIERKQFILFTHLFNSPFNSTIVVILSCFTRVGRMTITLSFHSAHGPKSKP